MRGKRKDVMGAPLVLRVEMVSVLLGPMFGPANTLARRLAASETPAVVLVCGRGRRARCYVQTARVMASLALLRGPDVAA